MPIISDSTALCSEVIDYLKSPVGVPSKYLSGIPFQDYYTLANAAEAVGNRSTWVSVKNQIFQDLNSKLQSYSLYDFSVHPVCTDFAIEPGAAKYPIVLSTDLKNLIANAFLPLDNIRKTKFLILSSYNGNLVRAERDCEAVLLNTDAILGTNANQIANNQNLNSRKTISTVRAFFDELSGTDYEADIDATIGGYIMSAYEVSAMTNAVSAAMDYIREKLWCVFSEFDTNGKVTVTYHKNNNTNSATRSSGELNSYSEYIVSGYTDLFGPPLSNVSFHGWNTRRNPSTALYIGGSKLYLQDQNVDLWPVLKETYKVIYRTAYSTPLAGDGNYHSVEAGSRYTIRGISNSSSSNTLYYRNAAVRNAYSNLFKGYATSKARANKKIVDYKVGQTITMPRKDISLWTVFNTGSTPYASETLDLFTKWNVKDQHGYEPSSGAVLRTNFQRYPLPATLSNLKYSSKLRFWFTGWVNESHKSHDTKIYVTIKNGKGYTIARDVFLFKFSLDPNDPWSVEREQTAPVSEWPRKPVPSNTGWINYNPPDSMSDTDDLRFYFYAVDTTVMDSERQGSDGVAGILSVYYEPKL